MNYTNKQLNLWNQVTETFRSEMATPSFDAWIKPLELVSVTTDMVTVRSNAPDNIAVLLARYENRIESAIKGIFGEHYSFQIENDVAPSDTNKDIVLDFINRQESMVDYSACDIYRYIANLPYKNRVRNCGMILMKEQRSERTLLHVVVELPIHIKRGEAYYVFKELAVINDDLEPNQCYDIDILEGTVRFRTIVDYPKDIDAFESIVSQCMNTVEQDFISIMQVVLRELETIEKAAT